MTDGKDSGRCFYGFNIRLRDRVRLNSPQLRRRFFCNDILSAVFTRSEDVLMDGNIC